MHCQSIQMFSNRSYVLSVQPGTGIWITDWGICDDISLLFHFSWKIKWSFPVFLGDAPEPRSSYQIPEPNGCSSSLVGFQVNAAVGGLFIAPTAQNYISETHLIVQTSTKKLQYNSFSWQLDLGIPAMTKCCNQLDICYDTCGRSKYDCDSKFRSCLHGICSDLKKSLGFVSKVQGKIGASSFFFKLSYQEKKLCLPIVSTSLSLLLSLWVNGRRSLQHSLDSGL